MIRQDLTGQRFGRLLVIRKVEHPDKKNSRWLCRCDCGSEKDVRASHLKSGNVQSCGCFAREMSSQRSTKHGNCIAKKRSPEYLSWVAMMQRCYNKNHVAFEKYGEAGIQVCGSWHDFINFLNDMGNRPKNTSLERTNNNLGYFKENCKWASSSEQQNNRKNNLKLTFQGLELTLMQWAKKINMNYRTLKARINLGWKIEDVLTKSVKRMK